METWDALRARRNVRSFTDRAVPAEHLEQVLEAGRRAPSSKNTQPWDFVLVTDKEQLAELATVWQGARYVAAAAAVIALVAPTPHSETERDRINYDLGQATMAMMLAAVDLGVGTGHSAVTDQRRSQKVLGFPDGRYCAYLIALGYPADGRPLTPLRRPDRRPYDEVVHIGRW